MTLLLALIALVAPRRMHLAFSLIVALVAFGAFDSFEFVRESVRKPYVIENYLYVNSLYSPSIPGDGGFNADKINDAGVLKVATWINIRELHQRQSGRGGARDLPRGVLKLPHRRRAIAAFINTWSSGNGIRTRLAPCSAAFI